MKWPRYSAIVVTFFILGRTGEAELATFGGGCFWSIEAIFEELKGVSSVTTGYAGGLTENPSFEQVGGKQSGHAQVVQVDFDPSIISYEQLMKVFFGMHDPTTPNRQGNDSGPQFRSIILYASASQKNKAEEAIRVAQENYSKSIVTEVAPLRKFYLAESNQQDFYKAKPKAPYCSVVIGPKIDRMRQLYGNLLKN